MIPPTSRRLAASAIAAVVVAVIALVSSTLLVFSTSQFQAAALGPAFAFYGFGTLALAVLVFVAAMARLVATRSLALIVGIVAGILGAIIGGILTLVAASGALSGTLLVALLRTLFGFNLPFWIAAAIATPTAGVAVYTAIAGRPARTPEWARVAFVRLPAATLADGDGDGVGPEGGTMDGERTDEQWDAYVAVLRSEGFRTVEVAVADDLPESVFVADTAVVLGDVAVLTRPGDERRTAETRAVETALRDDGYDIRRIESPGHLDGGDVLQVGTTVYVGRGTRTDPEGIRQLRVLLADLGRTVVAVPMAGLPHLTRTVAALPDGTVLGYPGTAPEGEMFDRFLAVPEPEGAQVLVLDPSSVLMAASAPRSAALVADLGYRVVTVDIGEFEKRAGSITRLSIRGA